MGWESSVPLPATHKLQQAALNSQWTAHGHRRLRVLVTALVRTVRTQGQPLYQLISAREEIRAQLRCAQPCRRPSAPGAPWETGVILLVLS